ncbi:DinB family protein [Litoribacter alkaliphilus]|uniref:DinB family protein n=1 Tax=Litoribacter ruber TaxID=702568 RepID=A0AAP2CI12_9BACT|nr:DinB family protein [Litoribacter alkaliphilus]MBS9525091.1 DinB family protein [Litoribacter alkaliphilus]
MSQKPTEWVAEIDRITAKFEREFAEMSLEQIYWKPHPEVWSIGENIQHLIQLNSSYFPMFQELKDGKYQKPWSGNFSFIYNLIGNSIYKSVSDGRKKKIKTFASWEPKIGGTHQDIVQKFTKHQQELKSWITKLAPQFGKNVVINSPINKLLPYTLDKAMDIIVAHEDRHFQQALEVKEAIKKAP